MLYFEEDSTYSAVQERVLLQKGRLVYNKDNVEKVQVDFFGNSTWYNGTIVGNTGNDKNIT